MWPGAKQKRTAKAYHVVRKNRANLGRWQPQRFLATTAAVKAGVARPPIRSTRVWAFARGGFGTLRIFPRRGPPHDVLAARPPLEHLLTDELIALGLLLLVAFLFQGTLILLLEESSKRRHTQIQSLHYPDHRP